MASDSLIDRAVVSVYRRRESAQAPFATRARLASCALRPEPFLKRPIDVILSSIGLILSSGLWVAIAAVIKLGDRGPIFYYQERWGRGGTRFTVRKFRTMIPESDRRFGIFQAGARDPRVTPVGRILRPMGLDELPQLLNICLGEMSLVGPRALAIGEKIADRQGNQVTYEQVPGFHERLAVRPGLTGIATVYLPKDSSAYRKFRYDRLYVRKQSVLLDLRLILLSLWISVSGKWETRSRKV